MNLLDRVAVSEVPLNHFVLVSDMLVQSVPVEEMFPNLREARSNDYEKLKKLRAIKYISCVPGHDCKYRAGEMFEDFFHSKGHYLGDDLEEAKKVLERIARKEAEESFEKTKRK